MNLKSLAQKSQRGVNMVGLIIWSFLAVIVMGGVGMLFVATSQQTSIGAEQGQQQVSILNALNRTSRDITLSNPIVYATDNEIVLDVTTQSGSVERRRYILNAEDHKVREYSKSITRGDSYDANNSDYWNNADRNAITVYSVKNDDRFFTYFDKKGAAIAGTIASSAGAEAIARVDIKLTANVANKGTVSLATSAVPRSALGLGGEAVTNLPVCPAFSATREGEKVTLRWQKASSDATEYEVTRNGSKIATQVADASKTQYSYTDSSPASGVVLNYMLNVISPSGISSCTDSVQTIVVMPGATQLTATLVPSTTYDASNAPVATNWSNKDESTKVQLKWQKVSIASGYVIYKQKIDMYGNPEGARETVATLEDFPYVDKNDTVKAADELTYDVNTWWDTKWEWTIKVLSRSGDNDETPAVRTLSYPAPVINFGLSAYPVAEGKADRVPVEDLQKGFGHTAIIWAYESGMEARGFDIYRSALDKPTEGFTKIAEVGAGESFYRDKTAELGSTYGYKIIAKNSSGFSNQFASGTAAQLQYPADPAVAPAGVTGSRDMAKGGNMVAWSPAKSATSYGIYRDNKGIGTMGASPAATINYVDSSADIKPATRFNYAVSAVNATGESPRIKGTVTLTQRPSAPALETATTPTLDSVTTGVKYNHTAGAWCVSGAYSGSGANCAYEQKQYANDGSVRSTQGAYSLAMNWSNQGWGRHYTYTVRAQNAAITNGGWSDESNRVAADTYPGPFSLNAFNGNPNGTNTQRVVYGSSVGNGGWGDVNIKGNTTVSWSKSEGSASMDLIRVHDGWQALSNDASVLLPSIDTPVGTVKAADTLGIGASSWSYIASPGTTYRYDVTARSMENNLTRGVSSNNTITPADVPKAGAVQVVCSGPGNGDATGTRSWDAQKITNRTQYTDLGARYGYYEHTAVEKLYTPFKGSGLRSNGWVGIAKGGNGNNIDASQGIGYFQGIESGFNFINRANGRTESATLGAFTNSTILTFDGCAKSGSAMQEPYDACYVATWAGCVSLNPDQRPKWLSK